MLLDREMCKTALSASWLNRRGGPEQLRKQRCSYDVMLEAPIMELKIWQRGEQRQRWQSAVRRSQISLKEEALSLVEGL